MYARSSDELLKSLIMFFRMKDFIWNIADLILSIFSSSFDDNISNASFQFISENFEPFLTISPLGSFSFDISAYNSFFRLFCNSPLSRSILLYLALMSLLSVTPKNDSCWLGNACSLFVSSF